MFSQYSWGDFFKFVLLLAVPYYAYVAWKYYREDIQDWFSKSKDKDQPASAPVEEEEEADVNSFFSSKTYSTDQPEFVSANPTPSAQLPQAEAPEQIEALEAEEVVDEPILQAQPKTTPDSADADIPEGVVVGQEVTTFDLGLSATPGLPTERSLADVLNAAKRLSVDNQGAYAAATQTDQQAAELANTLNEQKGLANVLSGVAFTR